MTEITFHITLVRNLIVSVCTCGNILFVYVCVCPTDLPSHEKKSHPGLCLNQVRKYAIMGERGGGTDEAWVRREGGEWRRWGGCCWLFLIQEWYRRQISIPDHRGTLGSVCLSLETRRVGGLSPTLHRLPVPVIFFCLYPHLLSYCDSFSYSFTLSYIFASIWVRVQLIKDGLCKYGQHQFAAHWRTSAQLEFNCSNWQLKELSPVVFSKVSVLISWKMFLLL